jgi:hypothetical protein
MSAFCTAVRWAALPACRMAGLPLPAGPHQATPGLIRSALLCPCSALLRSALLCPCSALPCRMSDPSAAPPFTPDPLAC